MNFNMQLLLSLFSVDELDFRDWQRFCIKMYPSFALCLKQATTKDIQTPST